MSLYEKLINSDICYICQNPGRSLISPCGKIITDNKESDDNTNLTNECDVKVHGGCLIEQIEKGNNNCPKCSNPILSTKVEKLNLKSFCYQISIILSYIFTYIIGGGSPGILIFGVLIDGRKDESEAHGSFILSLIISVFTGLLYVILGATFGFTSETKTKQYIKDKLGENWHLYFLVITSIIINCIILLCHFFGFIFLLMFQKGYHYDPYSFCVGLAVMILGIITILIIGGVFYCFKNIYDKNLEQQTIYGK